MIQDTAGVSNEIEDENMVKVQIGEYSIYYDGYLKSNLDVVKKNVIKQNYDSFIVVTGREGFGKSTLAFQVALYFDPTFNLDRVCFSIEQFTQAVVEAEKYQCIVFDETMGYLSSRQAMSKFNRSLIKIMSEMRSKNLFVILCIPNFFELDRYPGLHRTTGLLHIYKRSFFGSYDYPTKKKLYLKGKKTYSYVISPNFIGRFTKFFPLNLEKYEKKKQQTIAEFNKRRTTDERIKSHRDKLIKYLYKNKILNQTEIGKLIGLSTRQISEIVR